MPSDATTPGESGTDASQTDASTTDAATTDASSVFELLSDQTRVGILRELDAAEGAVAFNDLCTRVGIEDTGRFNYHLGRLRGTLVEKRTDGYVLTEAGEAVMATTDRVAPIAQ